jgi:hypothetical protein
MCCDAEVKIVNQEREKLKIIITRVTILNEHGCDKQGFQDPDASSKNHDQFPYVDHVPLGDRTGLIAAG